MQIHWLHLFNIIEKKIICIVSNSNRDDLEIFSLRLELPKLFYLPKCSQNLLPCGNLEAWGGEGGEREVLEGQAICHMYTSGMI